MANKLSDYPFATPEEIKTLLQSDAFEDVIDLRGTETPNLLLHQKCEY